jgi:branched-subunit amino acid transport protein AzlD
MNISVINSLLIILVVAALTLLTRYLPFALFSNLSTPSVILTDLGRILPPAVIAILLVYCLKAVNFAQTGSFVPQVAAMAVVAGLHVWKRNNLISIGAGTVFYMVLVQVIWK